jgi:hypothetical protein
MLQIIVSQFNFLLFRFLERIFNDVDRFLAVLILSLTIIPVSCNICEHYTYIRENNRLSLENSIIQRLFLSI